MGTVYILRSSANGRFYIGSTNDWNRRQTEHDRGQTKYTRTAGPFDLVFRQEYRTLEEARLIERKLKRFKSRKIIEKIINDGVIKVGS